VPLSSPNKAARVPVTGKNSQGRTVRDSSRGACADWFCWLIERGDPAAKNRVVPRHRIIRLRRLEGVSFPEHSENSREIFILFAPLGRKLAMPRAPYYKRKRGILAQHLQERDRVDWLPRDETSCIRCAGPRWCSRSRKSCPLHCLCEGCKPLPTVLQRLKRLGPPLWRPRRRPRISASRS
jgi:hypothetical protein